ncbi:MAG: purine/pyrimidine permease [Desulfobacteraceae bacterium]|nr:purine/pyrimidine permease [Desulfobacteraceae bacterium]
MEKPSYLYDIDDHPPFHYGILYGLQWAIITFPAAMIAVTICKGALGLSLEDSIRFLQLTLLTTGLFTFSQTLWGHRYPVLEGPSTAVILTFLLVAPYGLSAIQGGTIIGGILLIVTVLSKQLERIIRLFTPNVVGVILMLVAFGLLPALLKLLTAVNDVHPQGEPLIMMISLALVLSMATLSYRLKGFWKTISTLLGIIAGSLIFVFLGRLQWQALTEASWISFSTGWIESTPAFYWPAAIAFACAYLAVIVNSLGSLQGIAVITDEERLSSAIKRGVLINGISGISCGLLGVAGTVSYSLSPGVVLVNRVASRYTVTYCGIILLMAAFSPKLAALLGLVPGPVVGAALCVALGGQVGAGISIIASKEITYRDYFVVGLPVLLGTLAGFFPPGLFDTLPGFSRVFFGNSLVVGIVAVILLEHVLWREEASPDGFERT